MIRSLCLCASSLSLFLASPSYGDDHQKAQKQLHKLVAMATDATGRRIVSITVADSLGVSRMQLMAERKSMNLNYGDVVLLHALLGSGVAASEIGSQVKANKNLDQIAEEHQSDWKQLEKNAKKLFDKVQDNLYQHFINPRATSLRDSSDSYSAVVDGVPADSQVSKEEIAEAERAYLVWRDRADTGGGAKLDTTTEKSVRAMRGDPIGKAPEPGSIPAFSPKK
jgi:hypothetical protein